MKGVLKITLGIAIALSIFSCEKANEKSEFRFSSAESGQIRMYTKNGEVTNIHAISSFIDSYYGGVTFKNLDTKKYTDFQIKRESNNTGQIIYKSDSIVSVNISKNNGITYLSDSKALKLPFKIENDKKLKCIPIILSVKPLPMGMVETEFYPTVFALETNNEIHIPFVSYMEKKYYQNNLVSCSASINEQNIFDDSCLKDLGPTDTLVVQENKIIFK